MNAAVFVVVAVDDGSVAWASVRECPLSYAFDKTRAATLFRTLTSSDVELRS